MHKGLLSLAILCCILVAAPLSAQATRTWVSGVGDDFNPCSRTAPCKTFAGAISKTAACGEISVLDPGGYGAVTITKSITIDGSGTHASILNSGVQGVVVNISNAGDACKTVILRELSINGAGPSGGIGTFTGLNGIRQVSSVDVALHVEHVDISHQTQRGIDIAPTTTSRTYLKDVDIRHVTGDGIEVRPTAGQLAKIAFHDVRARQISIGGVGSTGSGVKLNNNAQGTINQSQFEANQNGVNIVASSVSMTIIETVMSNNNGSGLVNGGTAITNIDGCTFNNNLRGIKNDTGGTVFGFGNNAILNNVTDVLGAAVSTAAHP